MPDAPPHRLLTFARELQRAATFPELLDVVLAETRKEVGYSQAWLMVADDEAATELRMIAISGALSEQVYTQFPKLKVAGDAMLEQAVTSDAPVVVVDARTDTRTNKAIVAQLDNRTIINIPLRLLDKPFGLLGVGSFGDEGPRPPSPAQLEYLVAMAGQLAVATGRIRYQELQQRSTYERRDLERRIAQAQRLESVGLLAAGVAHDFNNLLTIVLTAASLARTAPAGTPINDDLDAIIDAAQRGAKLTRQMLALGRSQALALTTFDVNQRIRDLLAMLRRVIPENIELDFIASGKPLTIEGDSSQIDQTLTNLCINARDAMPDGGRLTIETEQVVVNGPFVRMHPWARSGRYALISVTDTGTGMPPEVVERIFDPFFSTKIDRGGTGLGLAVTYGIVRQHEGMVSCYSEPGVGTTFKIYLPLNSRTATEVGTKLERHVRGGTERILIAEDDPAIRLIAGRILRSAGYAVEIVANGAGAVAAGIRDTFDLAVLDVIMPGLSCRETITQLRAARPGMRLLLTSGYAADTNISVLLREMQVAFISKPYPPDQLLAAIRRALET